MIVSAQEIIVRLGDLGCADAKVMRDAQYFLPSEQWLRNSFAPFLQHEFWAYQRAYIKSQFDCEDFGFEAELEADIHRYVMSRAAKFALKAATRSLVANAEIGEAGHAFLYCEVTIRPGRSLNGVGPGKHATDLCLHPTGQATFFEPQNSQLTHAKDALDRGVCTLDWAWV